MFYMEGKLKKTEVLSHPQSVRLSAPTFFRIWEMARSEERTWTDMLRRLLAEAILARDGLTGEDEARRREQARGMATVSMVEEEAGQ